MFLTCLLNSRPPAFKRKLFICVLFHCFAVKYLREFNPCFVVFTFGSDSVLLDLYFKHVTTNIAAKTQLRASM